MYLYNKEKHFQNFKLKFKGLDEINQSYSQALQEMFVLAALGGKRNGTFLEIGADDPVFISNTYLLETKFEWNGISIDIGQSSMDRFRGANRTSKFIIGDAVGMDYDKILSDNKFGPQIDYLSLDIEPNTQTLKCLKGMPFDKYRFSVITYETDAYDLNGDGGAKGSEARRDESRDFIKSYGYELIAGNIANMGNDPFEDWYVDPNIVNKETIDVLRRNSDESLMARTYLLGVI